MNVDVNYLAVFLAAVSSMFVGGIWYAKSVFGKEWMKLVKLDEKKAAKMAPQALTMAFVLALVMAYVLAHVSFLSNNYFSNSFLQDSLSTAFWLWLGIAFTRVVTHDAFEQRPNKLTLMNVANMLVTMMVMGAIIGAMPPKAVANDIVCTEAPCTSEAQ